MLKLLLGDPNTRKLKRYQPIVEEINYLEEEISKLNDDQLRQETHNLKSKISAELDIKKQKELLEDFLPKAFAIVREASKRVLDMRHFDVQLIGGMVLHECQIAEMKTGEGKTLVATLPCYFNALTGKGVHVVTVNDYLARRDAEWMGQVHRFLGLSVGLIQQDMNPVERKKNYDCDITYATNSELGFDYLRDNMATDINEVVQRKFNYCVIDEVDSILIDEARTPLIISGPSEENTSLYLKLNRMAPEFVEQPFDDTPRVFGEERPEATGDFSVDEKNNQKHKKFMKSIYKKIIFIISAITLFSVIVGVVKYSLTYIENNPEKYLPTQK